MVLSFHERVKGRRGEKKAVQTEKDSFLNIEEKR